MEKHIFELNKVYARRKRIKRIVALLGVFVMLFTMNSLKMVAQTMSRKPTCGIPRHEHTSKCYDANGALICGKIEHQHTDACYQVAPTLEIEDDIDLDVPVAGSQVDEGLSLDLEAGLLDLNSDLVSEDVATPVQNNAVQTPVYILGEAALLSDIITGTDLNIGLDDIRDVGLVDKEGSQRDLIEIEKKDNGDYRIKALRDFESVELAVVLGNNEVVVVKLADGRAPVPAEQAAPIVEDQPAPVVDEQPEAPAVAEAQPTQPEAPAVEIEPAEQQVDQPQQAEAPVVENEQTETTDVVDEQADLTIENVQVEEPAADPQTEAPAADEPAATELAEAPTVEEPAEVPAAEEEQIEAPEAAEVSEPAEVPAVDEQAEFEQAEEGVSEPTEVPDVDPQGEPTEAAVSEQAEATAVEEQAEEAVSEPTEVSDVDAAQTETSAADEEAVDAETEESDLAEATEQGEAPAAGEEALAVDAQVEAPAAEEEAPAAEEASAIEQMDVDAHADEETVPADVEVEQGEEAPAEEEAEQGEEEAPAEEVADQGEEAAPADEEVEQGEEAAPTEEETEQGEDVAPTEEETEQGEEAAPTEEETEQGEDVAPAVEEAGLGEEAPADVEVDQAEEVAPAEEEVEQGEEAPAEEVAEQGEEAAPADEEAEQGEEDAPADEETEQGEEATPAEEEAEQGEEAAPAGEEVEQGEEAAPADEEAEQGEEAAPAEEETEQGEEATPADEEAEQGEEAAPADEETEQGEEAAPADEETEQGEEAAPADEEAEQGEEAAPAEEEVEQGEEAAPADEETEQGEEAAPAEEEAEQGEEAAPADEETESGEEVAPTDEEAESGEAADGEAVVYTTGTRIIEVNDGSVTLTWPAEAHIPDDVVITIEEIAKGSEDYDLLYHQALAQLPEPEQAVTQVMRFFDITLSTAEGEKIEPDAPVSVVVSVNETVESDVAALHCEEVGAPMETVDANAEGESVAFDAPSFSVYGVNYQVPAEQETVTSEVTVDLSRVDTMAAATVDGKGVSISIPELLQGADEAVESSVDSAVDAAQFVAEANITSADVTVENGQITLPVDALDKATVSLQVETRETDSNYITTVTTHTVDIVLSDYAGRTEETVGEGVTVKAVGENSLPADAVATVEENVEVPQSVEVRENESAAAFDISLTNGNGDAISGPVAVTVMPSALNVLAELPEGAVATDIQYTLIHVHDDGTVENISLPADAVVVDEDGRVESFSFETKSFSTYVFKYTVDFTYVDEAGNEHFWQFQGTGSHKLSEVLAALGIEAEEITAADLERTKTVGEFGEKDLYLTQDEETGEWYINSDAAFDDTYELTVVADALEYHVIIKDNIEYIVTLSISDAALQYIQENLASYKLYIVAEQITGANNWDRQFGISGEIDKTENSHNYQLWIDPSYSVDAVYIAYNTWNYSSQVDNNCLINGGKGVYTSFGEYPVEVNSTNTGATITIGNIGPVEHTARINFFDEWSDAINETANLVSGYTLEATVGEDTYVTSITGSGDLSFTKDGGATNDFILPDRVSEWIFKYNGNPQSAPIALGDYVISNANPSASNHIYTFEARKPNTYTASLTFKGDSGVAETPSSIGDNYYLVVNDAIYAPVTTSGLGNWVGVTDNKLPEITSFKFVQATGPVSSVSDLTGLTALDRIGDYDIVTSEVPRPDSSHNYAFEVAKPIICTASITVDGTPDLTDGDYYIVATKNSADVGYYKIGETADPIAFTAFAGGTVSLDTDTTFRVVKLATNAAVSVEAFAAATDVASYSGAKIGENRYTWALDEGTHNYAFSVAPDTLPAGTLRQVIVNLYCHNGTTLVNDSAATPDAKEGLTGKKMVIVARLEDKSKPKDDPARIIGFQAVEKTFDGHGTYDGIYFNNTFTGLAYPQNANAYNYASDVTYDSGKHDISIRMYVVDSGFNIGTVDSSVYNNLRSQAEAPEGYAFKSEPNGNVTSGTTTTLNLQKALSTKYQVKVQFEEATAIPESEKIFLYVQAQHATSGIDKFGGAVASTTPVTELTYVLYDPNNNPPSGWTQNNGGKFTGNENVWYTLYFVKQGGSLDVTQINSNTVSEIAEGGYVYGNTVSYTKQRTIEEIGNQNVITDYVVLTRIPTDSEYNFRTILGNGLYFGITANQLTQANDLQTNFACNTFIHEGHSVTPNLSGSSSGTFYIGEVTNSSVQINSAGNNTTCTIYVGEESKNQITAGSHVIVVPTTKANIGNIVNPILTHAKAVSDDMASHAPTMEIVVPDGANEFELNTKAFPEDATIYIDGDDAGLQRILAITDGLRITKYENQVIVFNFKTTKSVISHQYKINGVSSATQTSQGADGTANTGSDRLARGVVWNMNTEGGNFNAGTTLGIILAPNNGTVDIAKGDSGSSGAGWIIANTVKNWSGEWHNIYADMPAVNKAIINAKKTVNNRNAKGREKFLFKLERYNTNKQWEEAKSNVQNHGSAIEFANVDVNYAEQDCWTIYKITETAVVSGIEREEAYTTTDKVYYAAVYSDYVPAEPGQGTSGNVIYPTQYYESFSEDAYAATIGTPGYVPNKDSAPGVSDPIPATQTVPVFNNLYNTEDEDGLVVTKMMEGRSLTAGDVFTFTLMGTATTKSGRTISVSQTKTNDATGKVRFDDLKFAVNATEEQINSGYFELEVGDFDENYQFIMQLTLAEDTENLHGSVRAMTAPKILTVTVERTQLDDPNANEDLDVTISPKNNELVFKNKYDATGTAVITAKKAENSALGDRTFQFQLLKEDGTTLIETSAEVEQGQTATFKTLSYQLSDLGGQTSKDFTYKVKEVVPDDAVEVGGNKVKDGVTYDTTVHTVVVRMTDDGIGRLIPSYKVDDAAEFSATLSTPTFSNTYSATGTDLLTGHKTLLNKALENDMFSFSATPDEGNPSSGLDITAWNATPSNDASGNISFGSLTFNATGTWKFTVRETSTDGDGIAVDKSVYEVTFAVTDVNHDGTLTVDKTIKKVKNAQGNDIDAATQAAQSGITVSFENVYTSSIDLPFTANKVYNGTTDKTFTFKLTQVDDSKNPVQDGFTDTQTVTGNGSVTFASIPYTQTDADKTYYYLIKEVTPDDIDEHGNGTLDGTRIHFDTADQFITVQVSDDGKGKLTATPTYETAKVGAYDATFTNTELTSVSVTKQWAGNYDSSKITSVTYAVSRGIMVNGALVQDGKFNAENAAFTVTAAEWGRTWSDLDAYGSFSDENNQTVTGEFQYTVEETGFVYDGVTYTVTKGDGGYTVSKAGSPTTAWIVQRNGDIFTNTRNDTWINVKKVWKENDVEVTPPTDGTKTIEVTLYRNGVDIGKYNLTVDSDLENDPKYIYSSTYQWKINGLDKYYLDDNGALAEYEYAIVETQPNGWTIAHYTDGETKDGTDLSKLKEFNSGLDAKVKEDGTITVTNSKWSVSLPATGGSGTTLYYVGGIGLMLLAILGMILRRKAKEGID